MRLIRINSQAKPRQSFHHCFLDLDKTQVNLHLVHLKINHTKIIIIYLHTVLICSTTANAILKAASQREQYA